MTALLEIIDVDILTPKNLPSIGVYKILLHIAQFVLAFIVLCLSATVISTERTYYGTSQSAVNYSLVISLISLFLLAPMTIMPWTKLNGVFPTKMREGFFLKSRPNLIFNVFLTICWFVAMVSVAVHSNNDANCSLDSELTDNDPNYAKKWINQCNCAKAAAAFCVFCFFFWIATTVICVLLFWHEKKTNYANSDSSTIVEDPTDKEEVNSITSDPHSSFEEKRDIESAIIQPSPTTSPLTLTNDFASPYSPSAPHSPQPLPNSPQVMGDSFNSGHQQVATPFSPPTEFTYIPPQNMYAPSPLSQAYTSPHISSTTSPYTTHMSYPSAQSPPSHHNPTYQPVYQPYNYP